MPDTSWQDPPPPIDTMRYPPVTRRDLARYLAIISEGRYEQFLQARQSLAMGGLAVTLGGDPEEDFDEELASLAGDSIGSAGGEAAEQLQQQQHDGASSATHARMERTCHRMGWVGL